MNEYLIIISESTKLTKTEQLIKVGQTTDDHCLALMSSHSPIDMIWYTFQ